MAGVTIDKLPKALRQLADALDDENTTLRELAPLLYSVGLAFTLAKHTQFREAFTSFCTLYRNVQMLQKLPVTETQAMLHVATFLFGEENAMHLAHVSKLDADGGAERFINCLENHYRLL